MENKPLPPDVVSHFHQKFANNCHQVSARWPKVWMDSLGKEEMTIGALQNMTSSLARTFMKQPIPLAFTDNGIDVTFSTKCYMFTPEQMQAALALAYDEGHAEGVAAGIDVTNAIYGMP